MPSYDTLMNKGITYKQSLQDPNAQNHKYNAFSSEANSQENFERGQLGQGLEFADAVTGMSDTERRFLGELSETGARADANVEDEMVRLRQRGDDLPNVDQAYMQRAYQPGYERLMEDYKLMDQGVVEDMNRRGIASTGSSSPEVAGVESTPESHARMLLARDTKNQLGRNMLEAQNQAVQQKLAQYQGRLAETQQGNERFNQVQAPVIGANVASASDRLNARSNVAAGTAASKLGYAGQMHQINTNRKIAGQSQMLAGVGMGLDFTGDLIGAAASAFGGGGAKGK